MDQLKFEGDTLGQKHRNYNTLFKEITSQQPRDLLTDIDQNVDDVHNLFKVDVASKNKNVEYILGVLKGNDMLYVSRAIKQCPWLITDDKYAHIINPEHLHSQLFPLMMTKAANKLILHIRLNLRDDARVERFFNYYENLNLNTALKWLPQCSPAFIEAKVEKYSHSISVTLLKRLCEKNHNVLKLYINIDNPTGYVRRQKFQATIFLLNTHTNFFLDLVESNDVLPIFNSKYTRFIMKVCPERIYQNFDKYITNIDIPTFVKFLPPSDIGDLLLKKARNENCSDNRWLNYDNVQHFIRRMPLVQRVKFVTEVFIRKNFDNTKDDFNNLAKANLYRIVTNSAYDFTESYYWYKFVTFNDAIRELKETTKGANNRKAMLDCLIHIVSRDTQHIEELLQYYHDHHDGDECGQKLEFMSELCTRTNALKYNTNSWNIFNKILANTCLFKDKCSDCFAFDGNNPTCVQVVIIHKVINDESVPEVIMKKSDFNILKKYQRQLNSEDKSKLFDYLYNHLMKRIQNANFADLSMFDSNIILINFIFKLLKNWNKNLADYICVWNKISDLIKVKKNGLTWIYNVNKSWRKCMFEESIVLCPSEKTCINALKHDPSLLLRNDKEVSAMRCNDTVSLKQLLWKLKTYWPQSLASEWAQAYRGRLEEAPLGHKALTRGLCFLLPQCEMVKIIDHYKPVDAKICWDKDDENVISLRRYIAKNMHFVRPQPNPNMILLYAKGDYLQFALGSLNAIFYNLCAERCRAFVLRMLDAPVSLQKHGIRLAFSKMESKDLIPTLCNQWKTTKNVSIRTVMFKLTYKLLCKEKDADKIEKIWSLLNIFIDTLTFNEDKALYELLSKIENVPLQVRPVYLMKSYTFLKSLLSAIDIDSNKQKVEHSLNYLICHMNDLITDLEPRFVENILNDYITAVYTKEATDVFIPEDVVPLMVSFILFTEIEDTQMQRYEAVLLPVLEHTFKLWGKNKKDCIATKNFKEILSRLCVNLRHVFVKNMQVHVAFFAIIQRKLEEYLSGTEHYQILREWRLTVTFANILKESKVTADCEQFEGDDNKLWDALCVQAAPKFSNCCVELLKKDIETFFPCIYEHFSKALKTILDRVNSKSFEMEVLRHILKEDITQTYLVTILLLPSHCEEDTEDIMKLYKVILSHPSLEVKMHCYNKNKHVHGFRI
ncbi:uncharacterized protein [Choristoneura fumiferana]|uniref:uncharacterized protein n=1 Tax=Choristoneura fumiferana TaxID=7141 RepID=UPI003D15BB03